MGLYQCSSECKFYYIVGNCTNPVYVPNARCPMGHPLGSTQQQTHVPIAREGHHKVQDPVPFLETKINEIKAKTRDNYVPCQPKEKSINYKVRNLSPFGYRMCQLTLKLLLMIRQLVYREGTRIINNFLRLDEYQITIDSHEFVKEHYLNNMSVLEGTLNVAEPFLWFTAIYEKIFTHARGITTPDANGIHALENIINECVADQDKKKKIEMIQDMREYLLQQKRGEEIPALQKEVSEMSVEVEATLRPYTQTLRMTRVTNWREFEKEHIMDPIIEEYPLLSFYFYDRERAQELTSLYTMVRAIKYAVNKFNYRFSRKEVQNISLREAFEKDTNFMPLLEDFVNKWNQYLAKAELNLHFAGRCTILPNLTIDMDRTTVAILLPDETIQRDAEGHVKPNGAYMLSALSFLAEMQNNILVGFKKKFASMNSKEFRNILDLLDSLQYVNVMRIKDSDVIMLPSLEDLDDLVARSSNINPDLGKGEDTRYDFRMMNWSFCQKLIAGRSYLTIDNIPRINYIGESKRGQNLLLEVKKRVKQEKLLSKTQENFLKMLDRIGGKNTKDQGSELKGLYATFKMLLYYLSHASENGDLSLKDYSQKMNVSTPSASKDILMLTKVKNIVEVYNIIEDLLFTRSESDIFEDSDKDLGDGAEIIGVIKEFTLRCNGQELPKVEDLYRSI
eukprot:TRINITY_DN3909_c0_g1_i2.p1 TRINITY_DN3909_c0_g1~~TRINITY_DN3909_c0_g1_i2.p1  ORF type:complete len:677 (-),score=231.74 TRINITY_DN3909_c0_g1_i2:83-2113(-)